MRKGLRVFGHPVHPALSDFPIVLLVVGPAADAVALWSGEELLWRVGFWSLVGGLAFAVPTAISGLWDFSTIPREKPAAATALWHLGVMISAVSLAALGLALRRGQVPEESARALAVGVEAAALALILTGAWLGGHLVFHHGVGVEAKEEAPKDR